MTASEPEGEKSSCSDVGRQQLNLSVVRFEDLRWTAEYANRNEVRLMIKGFDGRARSTRKAVFYVVVALFWVIAACSGPAWAQNRQTEGSMRCGGRIIALGDSTYKVLRECGKPSWVSSHQEERVSWDTYKPNLLDSTPQQKYRTPLFTKEYVTVEEWTYNLGPAQFIRYLTFENDRLVSIETGDYGG